jgi:hypothetical protein
MGPFLSRFRMYLQHIISYFMREGLGQLRTEL